MALDGIKRRLAKVEARRPPNSDFDAWVKSLSDEELEARILSISAELEADGVDLEELRQSRTR